MPRLRKMRRKQKYQYHVNRRRLNQQSKKLPQINCDAVRKNWKDNKSVAENLTSMGLIADPNKDAGFGVPSAKNPQPQDLETEHTKINDTTVVLPEVVKNLEETAREQFKAKHSVKHPLPPEMYRKLTKFLNKYGEDYEAMSRDHDNYYQETEAQLRSQITRLKNIPQQWAQYLKSRDLLNVVEISE